MPTGRITSDPRVRWGTPCLRDTGISVADIVTGRSDGVDAEDVAAALEWYEQHGPAGLTARPPDPGPTHPRIAVDPAIQGGLPCVRGTRVTVDAVCGLLEAGFSIGSVLDEYPGLTPGDVACARDYARAARS